MSKRRASRTTLERRGRIIFGAFILLTVVGCLWWPWYQMERLVRAVDPDRAQTLAQACVERQHAVRFAANEESARELRQFRLGSGQEAKVIRLPPPQAGQPPAVPPGLSALEARAIEIFLKHPEEKSHHERIGDTFSYIQGLRAEGVCLDCHKATYKPGELLGIASLKLDLKDRNRTLLANYIVLIVAAVVVMILSMTVFYAMFRYMVVRPVQHLKDVADRVSEGDLRVRSEIDTGNELEALSDALNHMLDRLATTQAELRAANESRDAKLDELAKANVALFEMNQVKTKFLTTMSHELRTPLNSIIGFAQILSESPPMAAEPKLARYASNILTSGRMLLEMINDLLDLAKIEAGRVQVRCEKVSPPDLVEVVSNMVRPMLAETPLKFTTEVDPAAPLMTTDGTKVQQILYNLLSNAIKFTEEGEVRLAVRPAEGDRVAFVVADTGPGIAREQQLRIFDRFTQLDSSHTRKYRGTGLGLSIVKELTALLGGAIAVDSEPGKGSTFTVTLPVDSGNFEGRAAENGAARSGAEGASAVPGGG